MVTFNILQGNPLRFFTEGKPVYLQVEQEGCVSELLLCHHQRYADDVSELVDGVDILVCCYPRTLPPEINKLAVFPEVGTRIWVQVEGTQLHVRPEKLVAHVSGGEI